MFLHKFFDKYQSCLYVKINLYPKYSIKEIYKKAGLKDKDYILFALLYYARILRLMVNIEFERKMCAFFLTTNAINQLLEMDPTSGSFTGKYIKIKPIEIRMSDTSIHSPKISLRIDEIDSLTNSGAPVQININGCFHAVVKYTLSKIKKENKINLINAFAQLSTANLSNKLSSQEAIDLLNDIIASLEIV